MRRESQARLCSTVKCFVRFTFICLAVGCLARAQTNMAGHQMETQNQIPPSQLPAARKMTGIGNSHMRITANREARMWFNQGLNLVHDFWDYESARAFEQGVRADPQCAMCYWGLYKAESFYHSTAKGYARAALEKAVSLKNRVSERERLYIEASEGHEAAAGWRRVVGKYPKDLEARLLLAEVVAEQEKVAILLAILKGHPRDSGANHYYIHALEASDHPDKALHSAEILASLAPASGHMVHMPGHIFFRMGDYGRAEQAFAAAREVDERYMRKQNVQPDNDWNYVHNLMYSIADLMEEGKFREATALSLKLTDARGELESSLYPQSVRDSISRLNARLPVALRTADWEHVLALLEVDRAPAGRPNLEFLARQLSEFAEGMLAIEQHELERAEAALVAFDTELDKMSGHAKESSPPPAPMSPPDLVVRPDAQLPPLLKSLAVMSLELRASVLTAQGKSSEAKSLFLKAEEKEKALGYHEPPGYIRPVAETEGAAMMTVREWTEAKAAYQRALAERPKSGLALYGVAMSSEKAGDAAAAARGYAEFLAAWKAADSDLAQLAHAQSYVQEHSGSGGFTSR